MPLAIEKEAKVLHYVYENTMETFTRASQSKFISSLSREKLWDCYKARQDLTNLLKPMLPDDHFSYWESMFKLKRAKEIYKMEGMNQLGSILDNPNVKDDSFQLKAYLENDYK